MKLSCGQMAFYHLCVEAGIKEEKVEELYEEWGEREECSFADFEKWSAYLERKGRGMMGTHPFGYEPFIAQLDFRGYQHFIMVRSYGWLVSYIDVDGKVHHLPRFLFKFLFTGRIFVLDK